MSTRIICRLLVMCGLVAGLSMSGSVAQATCSFCDLSDGSCCDGQYAGCNCLEICGPGSKLPCGTTCAGYHGVDCRLRTGECVTGTRRVASPLMEKLRRVPSQPRTPRSRCPW